MSDIKNEIQEAIENYKIGKTANFSNKQFIVWLESQKEEIAEVEKHHNEVIANFNKIKNEYFANKKENESLKAITELAVERFEEIKLMLDMNHSDYHLFLIWKKSCDSLTEMAMMKNATS